MSKRTFAIVYAIVLSALPITTLIALLCHPSIEWNDGQIIFTAVFVVLGLFGSFLCLWMVPATKKEKQPKPTEYSSTCIMEYGDEILLVDGSDILSHLPNRKG